MLDRAPFSSEALARQLNPPQLEAVLHPPGPLLVVAGAGSGKTRVITYRLARLVATGADPRRVLAVTFTNKAAGEMRERVHRLLAETRVPSVGLWAGTFHSVSARLLRKWGAEVGIRKDFVIYDDDDQRRLLARVLSDLGVPMRMFPVRQVQWAIDRAQNQGIAAADFEGGDYFEDVVAKAYRLYQQRLDAAGATDFGGLLLAALALCEGSGPAADEVRAHFDHVLVDEFQDTNAVQARLVRSLARRTGSLTVVGDEDQSIYRWRGADVSHILDFDRHMVGAAVIKLEQNYRSTGRILRAANAVISRNLGRRPKHLFTEADEGAPVVLFEGGTERDEAAFVAARIADHIGEGQSARDVAVFYRTNAQSRALEDALRARDIPYIVVGGTRFYDRAEVKNLVAYLRAVFNPDDAVALARIINVPARGIGDATVERLATLARERQMSLWSALVVAARDDDLLGTAPRRRVAAFVDLMVGLAGVASGLSPAELAEKVLEATGYRDALEAEASFEAEGRMENLLELVGQMREYEREAEEPSLAGFLERIALASDADGYDPERGAVSLMTVHTAKGLEFPVVFLTGLEERIFPHARSIDSAHQEDLEEERRLFYVAVTRAKKQLTLSRAQLRRLSGQALPGMPSRFLRELPSDILETIVMVPEGRRFGDSEGEGPWGGRWSRDLPDQAGRRAPMPAPSTRMPGELSVHYDDDGGGEGDGLVIGARIRHSRFGVGEVRGWQGAGAGLKVTVRFPDVGLKTILARYLSRLR